MGFHVFLSHNSKDKPAVRELKQRLLGYLLTVWFDEDELQPGKPWQQLLEDGITKSGSIAVLVGKDGLGPWEDEEMQGALRLAVANKRPVIPVLLPGAVAQPKLPMFLGNRTWVDLRSGLNKEGLDKLVWGITGEKPGATTVANFPSPKVTIAATLESQTQRTTMTRCKVLFLAANPLDCTSLQLDEEARAIEQRILQTNHRDVIDFVPKFAVRRDDLQLHLNKEQPHVLHFSGHGSKDEIAFKGDDGNAVSVRKAGLKAMLKAVKDNIRLVVLNACYTRQQADSITDVIDCAIGMRRGMGDEAARVFAASFYLAIGFGRSLQNAFDQAVAALQVMGIPEEKTPILSCREGIDAANVFLVEATEKPTNPQ